MSRGSVSHSYEYIPNYSTAIQQIIPERFILKIRQQPVQTRLSTNNERDRRTLDPPPIVQIELDNSNAQETQDFLQNPYLFMSVSLVNPSTHEDIVHSTQNTLSGQTSSSMYKLKDINNHDGGFFVFGDLSVKLEGQFRLKFSMFEISTYGATNLKSIYSNVFQVYPSKTFPGVLESTFLSRSFSDQGVRIRIRKEHRVQMTGSRKRKLSSQDDVLELPDERGTHPYSHHAHQPHQSSMLLPYSNASSTIYPPQSRSPWPSSLDYDYLQQRRSSMNSSMTSNSDSRQSSYHHLQHIDRRPSVPYSPPHQSYDHHRPNNNGHGAGHAYYDHAPQHLHPHHPHHSHHPHHPHHQQPNYAYYSHGGSHNYHRDSMIPSPPPQSSLFKSDTSRRLSLDDTLPLRRQSADPRYDSPHHHQLLNGPRRLSLQQYYARLASQPPPPPPLATSSTTSTHNSSPLNEEIIHLPPLRSVIPRNSTSSQHKQPHQERIVEVDAAVAMVQLASRRQLQQQKEGHYST
ncbi:Tim44 domain-containing protein [Mucor velutinosus]|uniref:Tim44 domain-containing protein n=1 Tax=Mucor velutinosus TaxID=708070 RepID=A0AAN7DCG5_9FUNG|nr:Tim44 domain-containing protein [Mucor velutinosus]